MSAAIEKQSFWPSLIAELKKKKLRDLAREYKVPVAELQQALERTGHLPGGTTKAAAPAPVRAAPVKEVKVEAKKAEPAPAVVESTRRGGATARLEAARHRLGVVTDGDLAKELGIARKTVVEYRKKHGIRPYSTKGIPRAQRGAKGGTVPAPAAAAVPVAEPKRRGRPPKAPPVVAPVVVAPVAPKRRGRPPGSKNLPKPVVPVAVAVEPKRRGRPPKALAAAPAAPVVAAAVTGRPSKLDAFRDIVGKMPDRDVAERSGMTTENVRMYRQRRSIPATWRDGAAGAAPAVAKAVAPVKSAAPAKVAAPAVVRAPAPKVEAAVPATRKRGRQPAAPGQSKVELALAPFRDVLGSTPDAEVAVKAGVSRSAVSAFRTKYKIKASGRGGRPPKVAAPAPVAKPVAKPVVAPAPPAPKVAAPIVVEAPKPVAAPEARGAFTYRITAIKGDTKRQYAVMANDPVDAAQRAHAQLTAKDKKWVIREIRLVADTLPE